MNKLRTLAAGVALTVATANMAACATNAEEKPSPTWTVSLPELLVEPAVNPDEPQIYLSDPLSNVNDNARDLGEETRALIAEDAPINLVLVDPEASSITEVEPRLLGYLFKLINNDAKLLQDIAGEFIYATHGRYFPEAINVTQTDAINTGECLDSDNALQDKKIAEDAGRYLKPGHLNLFVIANESCPKNFTGGYASVGDTPVITLEGMGNPTHYPHEIGHSAGLHHANSMVCAISQKIDDRCLINSKDDQLSVMAYTQGRQFSVPEMHTVGLLEPGEVIQKPKPGVYRLGSVDNDHTSTKALMIPTYEGLVYISWELDPQASHDVLYLPGKNYDQDPNKLAVGYTYNDQGEQVDFTSYAVNHRPQNHSVQVRILKSTQSKDYIYTDLNTLPDRAPDFLGDERSNGEVQKDAIVYKNDRIKVKYSGLGENNQAIIEVTEV